MTITQFTPATIQQAPDSQAEDAGQRSRISFRQPVSTTGFIDAAWWPRSRDLTTELPPLMDVLWTAGREINRVSYNLHEWNPAPRRIQVEGRSVRLGGFTVGEPSTVQLTDPWGDERIDVLVIAPDTDPDVARRIFDIASTTADPYRANDILDGANRTIADPLANRS